jgi:transposase
MRMTMTQTQPRIEVITGVQRRRRWSVEEKVRLVEESSRPGMSVSYVARIHGIAPSQLFHWRRRMAEGSREAVRADDDVVSASEARELKRRIRELERVLGKKTMEVEILREALTQAQGKKPIWQLPSPPADDSP